MIGNRHQIGVEGRLLRCARSRRGEHGEDIGGLRQRRRWRDRCFAALQAQDCRQEDGGCGQQAKCCFKIISIRKPGDERAQDVNRRQLQQIVIDGGDMVENLLALLAQPHAQAVPVQFLIQQTVEQENSNVLVACVFDKAVERHSANDKPAGLAIDIGQLRFGRDDVFKSIFHLCFSFTPWMIRPSVIDVNLDEIDQYEDVMDHSRGSA